MCKHYVFLRSDYPRNNPGLIGKYSQERKNELTLSLTSQLWLGNIHLTWDAVISRIRLGGLIGSLKRFLQLNMCQELQIFAVVYEFRVQVKSC